MFIGVTKGFLLWSSQLCGTTSENTEKNYCVEEKILTIYHKNAFWYLSMIMFVWYC